MSLSNAFPEHFVYNLVALVTQMGLYIYENYHGYRGL